MPASIKKLSGELEPVVSVQSVVLLQQLFEFRFSLFVQHKQLLTTENVCEGGGGSCMTPQTVTTAGADRTFKPWCTRSSHNAALPATDLSRPLGLDIPEVSAC